MSSESRKVMSYYPSHIDPFPTSVAYQYSAAQSLFPSGINV